MKFIGKSIPKIDGYEKVTGTAKYTTDYVNKNMLYAKLLISPHAHAKIVSIDTSEARLMPGIKAVLTGDDFPSLVGVLLEDKPILARNKVRYHGEPVAVVVADSELEAERAVQKINVKYEELPVVNSASEAFSSNDILVHEDMHNYRVLKPVSPVPNTNIANLVKIRKGDMKKGWDESEFIVEAAFSLPQSDHVALETRNVRCEIKKDGKVEINTSTQGPFTVRDLLSRYFQVPSGNIVVKTPYVGGAFGGKAAVDLEYIAYLASKAVDGKLVKIVNSREEDMISSPVKIGLEARIKLGCSKDGMLKAAELTYLVDIGAYSNMGVGITRSIATDCTGPYNIENVYCDACSMYTNHPFATSFRGFGHGEYTFAIERTMELLAQKAGIDPLNFRMINAIKSGNTSPTMTDLSESNLGSLSYCLQRLKEMMNWNDRNIVTDLGNGRVLAKGIGCLWKSPSTPTNAASSAIITMNPDGSININIGSVELGPGTKTGFAQMAAEKLGLEVNQVHVNIDVNTSVSPVHWKTVASMSTFMVGRAIEEALNNLIAQIKRIGSSVLRCSAVDLEVAFGRVYVKDEPAFYIDLKDLAHGYQYTNGNSIGGQIIGHGSYIMRHLSKLNQETGAGKSGPTWTVGAQGVDVIYDRKNYTYKVIKAYSVIDSGPIINPSSARGVVMGGMSMGLGLATREGFIFSDKGIIENNQLRNYKIISFDENPEYVVDFIQTSQIDAFYGSRGIGEHGLIGMPAALGNAISAAAEVNIHELPVLPETIFIMKEAVK